MISVTRLPDLLLDVYCGAGGCSTGYSRAGWEVVGVDWMPQPHYPFPFIQLDARQMLRVLLRGLSVHGYRLSDFGAIHASPPCQLWSIYNNNKTTAQSTAEKYENLIPQTRELLERTGLPWIMENVVPVKKHLIPRGQHLIDPVQLCGTGLGIPVRRHRLIELGGWSLDPAVIPGCAHERFTERRFPGSSNRPNGRTVCNVGEYRVPLSVQKECMQVDWDVDLKEISQMPPPVYTEFLGRELRKHLKEHGKS